MARNTGVPPTLFASPSVTLEAAGGPGSTGDLLFRSAEPLRDYPVTVLHSLRQHARTSPGHPLVAERRPEPGAGWRCLSYGEVVTAAASIGQALLDLGLGPLRPRLILSANSVDHLLMTRGAMTAGPGLDQLHHAYPAHAAFGGYKQSGVGRETHKMMLLDHYQQTKNLLVSYSPKKLGFF